MSSYEVLARNECAVLGFCPDYLSTLLGPYFLLIDEYPIILSFALYSISLYHFELYFFLFGASLNIDSLLNWLLTTVIAQSSRYPGCGATYEFPSFATEHATVGITMLLLAIITWRRSITPMKLLSLITIFNLVVIARVYKGVNTIPELVVGSVIGFIEAQILHWIIARFIYPHFDDILGWRICKLFGAVDTLCRSNLDKPVL